MQTITIRRIISGLSVVAGLFIAVSASIPVVNAAGPGILDLQVIHYPRVLFGLPSYGTYYEVNVKNASDVTQYYAHVSFNVPAGFRPDLRSSRGCYLTYVDGSPPDGSVVCPIGELARGDVRKLGFTLNSYAPLTPGTQVPMTFYGWTENHPYGVSDSVKVDTWHLDFPSLGTVFATERVTDEIFAPATVRRGEEMSYAVRVTNGSRDTQFPVHLYLPIPEGLTWLPDRSAAGGCSLRHDGRTAYIFCDHREEMVGAEMWHLTFVMRNDMRCDETYSLTPYVWTGRMLSGTTVVPASVPETRVSC